MPLNKKKCWKNILVLISTTFSDPRRQITTVREPESLPSVKRKTGGDASTECRENCGEINLFRNDDFESNGIGAGLPDTEIGSLKYDEAKQFQIDFWVSLDLTSFNEPL